MTLRRVSEAISLVRRCRGQTEENLIAAHDIKNNLDWEGEKHAENQIDAIIESLRAIRRDLYEIEGLLKMEDQ